MHSLKRKFPTPQAVVAAMLPVILLFCAPAHAASDDTLTEKFYARAGGGVYVLDMSESSPFIRTNSREEAVGFLDHYDASFQAGPLVNLAIGSNYDAFGNNLFTELSGFLTFSRSTHVNEYSEDPAPWAETREQFVKTYCPQGTEFGVCLTRETSRYLLDLIKDNPDVRAVGWVGKIDGGAMPGPMPGSPIFAWGDPIRISTQREVDFHGVDLVTGMFFGQSGQSRTSFFIGPSYKRLNQESETFAYESNRPPEINSVTLKETLKASYYGGVIGTRVDLPFKERWKFTFDGRLGVYYLDSEYDGSQRTLIRSVPNVIDAPTDWKISDSAIATTLNFQTALSVTCMEKVTFQLGTGIEYLSHAPKMRYASLGESFIDGRAHSPARIEYSNAFGLFSSFSVVLRM